MRRPKSVAGLVVLGLAACTGPVRTPEPQPVSAVAELSRLQATGQIESSRLECALFATIAVVDELRVQLPTLREARREEAAAAMSAHAQSVRDNQRQAEITSVVGAQEAMMREQALELAAAGNDRAAMLMAGQANRLLEHVRGDRLVTGSSDVVVPLVSDEEAELLAEYARLRSEFALSPVPGDVAVHDRMRAIEREREGIQERYATLFLQIYQDPELRCTVRD